MLFAVNRPLLSSKLKRLPLRGMLGNGLRVVMGAVAALEGTIFVASRGRHLTLTVDTVTGQTIVENDEPIPATPGTRVTITLSAFDGSEAQPARDSIAIARNGNVYIGLSRPSWYGPKALRQLFAHVVPETATAADVLREVFGIDRNDLRLARDLVQTDVDALHEELTAQPRSRSISAISVPAIGSVTITPALSGKPRSRARRSRTRSSAGPRAAAPKAAGTATHKSTYGSIARRVSPGSSVMPTAMGFFFGLRAASARARPQERPLPTDRQHHHPVSAACQRRQDTRVGAVRSAHHRGDQEGCRRGLPGDGEAAAQYLDQGCRLGGDGGRLSAGERRRPAASQRPTDHVCGPPAHLGAYGRRKTQR